jgi:Na+/melibiose symporter-like transporter
LCMKWVFIILGGLLVLATILLPIILLFTPLKEPWLADVRDASIIYASMFMCVGAILSVVMTGLLAFIAFQIRERIVPALQKVDDTAKTVKGTATFVSESVVAPIIKAAGAAAGARAMVQTLMRREPPRPKQGGGA